MKLYYLAVVLIFGLLHIIFQPAQATFVPESEIHYDSLSVGHSQVTQEEFLARIGQLQKTYEGAVSRFGGKLAIEGNWTNDKIVAQAAQIFGTWKIQFSGGLARRPELTGDGMTLIICHEIGHLIAGFPFAAGNPLTGVGMANEGEADYFSTHVCAKKMWAAETERNAEFRKLVNPFAKEKCDTIYTSNSEQDLCYRATVGGESVIATMASLKNEPMSKFETPDPTVVSKTKADHPATQCRMDTLFQGLLCSAFFNELIIPGKKVKGGPSSVEAEREAALNSCTKLTECTVGLRPTCWFKPRM